MFCFCQQKFSEIVSSICKMNIFEFRKSSLKGLRSAYEKILFVSNKASTWIVAKHFHLRNSSHSGLHQALFYALETLSCGYAYLYFSNKGNSIKKKISSSEYKYSTNSLNSADKAAEELMILKQETQLKITCSVMKRSAYCLTMKTEHTKAPFQRSEGL